MVLNIGLVLVSYLIGSIPTGLLLGRAFAKIDIREYGSHNIGATNVYRSAGKTLGVLTLLGDTLKGFLPVYPGIHNNRIRNLGFFFCFSNFFGASLSRLP